MAMRFELATRRVTSPDSEMFTPFELQVNFTQKMLALPYQKYTFSERKFDEEFNYQIYFSSAYLDFWIPHQMSFQKMYNYRIYY